MRTLRGVVILVLSLAGARVTSGQSGGAAGWNDARTRSLVELATRRRAEQLADTGLVDYRTTARGYVTFLAQLGEGFLETPKLVKTDQLALEVYWHAPNQSKQRIVGRRDTLLLPTDIQYHRDHLGIVQNNFPDIIRIGEGDEVRDVPHPLSAAGLRLYDFQISDSIQIRAGADALQLIEVKIRPKEDRDPRVVGAVYLEPAGGQVVKMAFNFTRAAFLDRQLEDLAIVLENRLVASRYWLPSKQQIEIRRTGTWMDYPVRGIIRGWWEIGDYSFNLALPEAVFAGPEIVSSPAAQLRLFTWEGSIIDSLPPDVLATSDPEIQRIQAEARALVRARALERVQGFRVSARRASDFVRVNRVEGLSIGFGTTVRLGSRLFLSTRARLGTDDHRLPKAGAALRWEQTGGVRLEAFAERDLADVGDLQERSGVFNSLAAQEFASDMSDPYSRAAGGLRLSRRIRGIDWTVTGTFEEHRQVGLYSIPASGAYEDVPQITPFRGPKLSIAMDRPMTPAWLGGSLRMGARASALRTTYPPPFQIFAPAGLSSVRLSVVGEHRSSLSGSTLVLMANGGSAFGDVPLQDLFYFGGTVSLPGYRLHDVAGKYGAGGRAELRLPVPFPRIPLGRFGSVPGRAHVAPYVAAAAVGGSTGCVAQFGRCPSQTHGVYPAAGVALFTFFDMLRFDVARGLKDGKWAFNIDVNRDFWPIL